MLWNCPYCNHPITPKTLKSVKLEAEDGRRAMLCPACDQEVEMDVHPAEYWQLAIPAVGLLFLVGQQERRRHCHGTGGRRGRSRSGDDHGGQEAGVGSLAPVSHTA